MYVSVSGAPIFPEYCSNLCLIWITPKLRTKYYNYPKKNLHFKHNLHANVYIDIGTSSADLYGFNFNLLALISNLFTSTTQLYILNNDSNTTKYKSQ